MSAADRITETDENQSRASDPHGSAWVSANAGAGKTKVLVERVLRLLLHVDENTGTYNKPENALCLTYTKAAAAEMENRLFTTLSGWVVMDEEELSEKLTKLRRVEPSPDDLKRARQLFAVSLDTKGGLKIHTIHAFCERLLHRFPIEAGIQADFKVLEEQEKRVLLDAAIDAMLERAGADRGGPTWDALQELLAATGEENFRSIIDVAVSKREDLRAMTRIADGFASLGEAERHGIATTLGADINRRETDIWQEMAGTLSDGEIDMLLRDIPADKATEQTLLEALARVRAQIVPDLRGQALCDVFLTQDRKPRKSLMRVPIREEFPAHYEIVVTAQDRVAALASELSALHIASCSGALITLADGIIADYERSKVTRAVLDYDDLIARTVLLLQSSSAAQWVLYKLDTGIDHILVDEAQDTSPPQWRVIEALVNEFFAGAGAREGARTVFAVGDEKQSIYSFQGADPASFAHHGRMFEQAAKSADQTFRRVPLTVSFRSTDPILKSVDDVFATPLAGNGVVWGDQPIVHQAVRTGRAGLVEVWPVEHAEEAIDIHAMRPFDEQVAVAHARDTLAQHISTTIRHWLDTGEKLEARGRPMRAGDILILVRSRDAFVQKLIRALKSHNIPVAGADRMKLTEQLAVMDMMALADFVLLPDDDLNLATLLKSPLIGLDDDDLFALAYKRPGALWNALRDRQSDDPRYVKAVEKLMSWLKRADQSPPFEFFAGLLEENQMALRLALIARLGPDAGDAIDEFLNMALDYERTTHPSLQGFLDWVRKSEAEVKRDMEHGRDEVRIMTAHGAKGLEANVVILPDTCKSPTGTGGNRPKLYPLPRAGARPGEPSHLVWVPPGAMSLDAIDGEPDGIKLVLKNAEKQEQNRLLYVAMTRARDRLYVCGWTTRKNLSEDCWYMLVKEGLSGLLQPATGALGDEVLRYSSEQERDVLDDDDEQGTRAEPRALPEWACRDAQEELPPWRALTPSSIPGDEGDEDDTRLRAEQDVVPPRQRADRSRFLRGNIVHALLQYLPDIDASQWDERAKGYVAHSAPALDADRQAEIVAETLAILRREDFAPLFGPGSQAEAPIVARLETSGGEFVQLNGQVDRLVVLDDEVLIVDYKTNRPPPTDPDLVAPLYIRQLAAYRAALSRVYPEKKVHTALLWTDGPDQMWIDDEKLDAAAAILGVG